MTYGPNHIPMERVLNPDQCEEMREFFGKLIDYADKAQDRKPNVTQFIAAWREIYGQYYRPGRRHRATSPHASSVATR